MNLVNQSLLALLLSTSSTLWAEESLSVAKTENPTEKSQAVSAQKQALKISVDELAQVLKKNPKAQILDARALNEFELSHISNAQQIDLSKSDEFNALVAKLDKSKPVYTYSINAGGRGFKVAQKLAELGFNASELQGGISKWLSAGQKVESKVKGLSVQEFNKKTNAKEPVLVFVHGEFCGGCQKLAPIVGQVEASQKEKLKVVHVELFNNPEVAKSLKVDGVPTLILYKNGKPVWRNLGQLTEEEIKAAIQAHS